MIELSAPVDLRRRRRPAIFSPDEVDQDRTFEPICTGGPLNRDTQGATLTELPDGRQVVLEIVPVSQRAGVIYWVRPLGPSLWQIDFTFEEDPCRQIINLLARYSCSPLIVHSTSWRYEANRMILTYLAALPATHALNEGWICQAADGDFLARGSALEPPAEVDMRAIVNHALRHLAWLALDDPSIGAALRTPWIRALEAFLPAPFVCLDDFRAERQVIVAPGIH